jgi:nucleoid DNA-binding protein
MTILGKGGFCKRLNILTHADFVKRVAKETQIAQKYVKEVLEAATSLVRQELMAGRKVNLHNLGIFKPVIRSARSYRAPFAPGSKPVKKPASTGVNFKPARDFKRELNS